jgi:hypothetical protein
MEMMVYVLCLEDLLKIKYDEDRLLTDVDYGQNTIKKLNEKSDIYNSKSAIEYFRAFGNRDKLKTGKYIRKLEEYQRRIKMEEQ